MCSNQSLYLIPNNLCCNDEIVNLATRYSASLCSNSSIVVTEENVGCSRDDDSQMNLVIQPTQPELVPQNFVIRTSGIKDTYGSFARDDNLTTLKGDIRGSGAVDLSVFREECDQVASGEYSVISGGANNKSSGDYSVVGGGNFNDATGEYSVISGGLGNTASGQYSVISGGKENTASANGSVVGGGQENTATGVYSVISGGLGNTGSGVGSVVSGGVNNTASGLVSVVSGGEGNIASGDGSVVSGGLGNIASGLVSVISGGQENNASGIYSVVSGGQENNASGDYSVVGGGNFNDSSGAYSVVSGGQGNTASGNYSVVSGGNLNITSGDESVVSGGVENIASGLLSVISGGGGNNVSGDYSVVSGGIGNNVSGDYSVVGGGLDNITSGTYSVVGGGEENTALANYSSILGGKNNFINNSSVFSSILGGSDNFINNSSIYSSILGGSDNVLTNAPYSYASGNNNLINSCLYSTVGGADSAIRNVNYGFAHGEGLLLDTIDNSTAFGQYNEPSVATFAGLGFVATPPILPAVIGATTTIPPIQARIFMIGDGLNSIVRSNAMSVLQGGSVISSASGTLGAFIATGADYAEYMESKYYDESGNLTKIPFNYTVVVDDDGFVKPSNTPGLENKTVIGAISINPVVVGNDNTDNAYQKYLKDETGKVIQELYTYYKQEQVFEEKIVKETKIIYDKNRCCYIQQEVENKIKTPVFDLVDVYDSSNNLLGKYQVPKTIQVEKQTLRYKLDPNFDPSSIDGLNRQYNPNWTLVGLMGQIIIRNDQRVNPNWIRIKPFDSERTIWLVR